MFKNILISILILVSFNSAFANEDSRLNCKVIKVLNAESGFQVGSEIQFTANLDKVYMDDFSTPCQIISSEIDQVNQETVQCEDTNLMTFMQSREVLVIEDVAVLTCQ